MEMGRASGHIQSEFPGVQCFDGSFQIALVHHHRPGACGAQIAHLDWVHDGSTPTAIAAAHQLPRHPAHDSGGLERQGREVQRDGDQVVVLAAQQDIIGSEIPEHGFLQEQGRRFRLHKGQAEEARRVDQTLGQPDLELQFLRGVTTEAVSAACTLDEADIAVHFEDDVPATEECKSPHLKLRDRFGRRSGGLGHLKRRGRRSVAVVGRDVNIRFRTLLESKATCFEGTDHLAP